MKLRDLFTSNFQNINRQRNLFESILIPEVEKAFNDWDKQTKDIEYVLIGGIALSYYAKPRTTTDVDTLFPKGTSGIPNSILGFKRHRANAFQHNDTHVEIEVLTPEVINIPTDLAQAIYTHANVIDGVRVATPSGLICSKLGRFKLQDQADIETLLSLSDEEIDLSIYPLPLEWLEKFTNLKTMLNL